MDARTLAWLFISTVINIIEPTSSLSLKEGDNFAPSLQIQNAYMFEESITTSRRRNYRQADLESITSIEPIVTTESGLYEQSGFTEKYNTIGTTEGNTDKTVLPLTSTQANYSPETSEEKETNQTETDRPFTSTDLEEVTKYNTTVEGPDLSKDYKTYEVIEPTWNVNGSLENVTPFTQGSTSSENESNHQLELVGISKLKNLTDRIMILQSTKRENDQGLKETVHNMLENTMLRSETEDYVVQLNQRYEDLPLVDADNSIWRKYSRAVVESFVLDFCRSYPNYEPTKVEDYNRIYNMTLQRLQQKKVHTAVQFAAPVRRVANIYRAILDTSIGIVQSKCTADMPRWLCFAEYVVRLTDISETCEHVWYHAQVHLTVLQSVRRAKGVKDPATKIIAELDARLSALEMNYDVNYLFDFIVETLGTFSERLKESLLTQAGLYNLIRELQSEDKLNCLNIDDRTL